MFRDVVLNFHIFVDSLVFLCHWFLVSHHCDEKYTWYDLPRLVLCPVVWSTWRIFCVHLRTCILLLLDKIFYKCLLRPFNLIYRLSPWEPYWCCLDDTSIAQSGALESPTITILLPTSFQIYQCWFNIVPNHCNKANITIKQV